MKCRDCVNDCYRENSDKTGCKDGKDCARDEHDRRVAKFIKGEKEPKGEIIFSVSKCTQVGMQDIINKVLENGRKIYINGITLVGFKKCTIFTDWMEFVFDDGDAKIEVPFEYNTNVRVDYIGQDIKIVLEAL